ncbi:AAA family ATPase [Candidatus Woesearchaeota archaeon]|nr:AAA family ATPase [Candidatus Woesearchaeota archaeon]
MGIFKEVLGAEESLFRDHIPLDYDYIPKPILHRENEQQHIAMCIKPLLAKRNGRNLFLYGLPGVGKTAACKQLLKELEEETEEIIPLYINCWQKNTAYKIILSICEMLEYRFTQNKKTDELFDIAKNMLNKKAVVFVFDEVDKLEEEDILYYVLENIYRKTVILITNYKEWIAELDNRIKSRLTAELLEFKPYNELETRDILKHRLQYAFTPDVWEADAFAIVAKKAFELQDIRAGLYLMKEAGNAAEDRASRKITQEHVETALRKLEEFSIKKTEELEDEERFILSLVKQRPNSKIGDLFKLYQQNGGSQAYKSFQRKINKLADNRFIAVKKLPGGKEGNTTIVSHIGSTKKLTEY